MSLFLNNRTFAVLGTAHLLIYSGILALPFTLTLYFQYIKGFGAQTTGYILLIQALCTALVAPFTGWLAEKSRPRYLIFCGIILFVIASLMLVFLQAQTPIWWVLLALGLIGTGVGVMDAPIIHTCMSSVNEKMLGSASATLNGLRIMGGFVGIGVVSFLMDKHLGEREIEPQLYNSLMTVLHQFFQVAATLAVLGLVLLVAGVVSRPRNPR